MMNVQNSQEVFTGVAPAWQDWIDWQDQQLPELTSQKG